MVRLLTRCACHLVSNVVMVVEHYTITCTTPAGTVQDLSLLACRLKGFAHPVCCASQGINLPVQLVRTPGSAQTSNTVNYLSYRGSFESPAPAEHSSHAWFFIRFVSLSVCAAPQITSPSLRRVPGSVVLNGGVGVVLNALVAGTGSPESCVCCGSC